MKFIVPFPPSILRPNDRSHWAKKNPEKNAYKAQCQIIASQYVEKIGKQNLPIKLIFCPPNQRWDIDAMLSAMKPGIDGIAIALNINDKQFRPMWLDVVGTSKDNPHVIVEIKI